MEAEQIPIESVTIKAHIDLETSCRICLLTDSELFLIFDQTNSYNGVTLATMINECSPNKAIRFDDFPQHVCLKCVEDVKVAYTFRKHCEESYAIISAYLNGGIEPWITDPRTMPKLDKTTQTEANSIHPCEKCDLKFFTYESLRLHRHESHRGTRHECRVCNKIFRRIGVLTNHYAMYHPELGFNDKNMCQVCGRIFEKKYTLKNHLEKMHNSSMAKQEPINDLVEIPDFDGESLPEPVSETNVQKNEEVKTEKSTPVPKRKVGRPRKTKIAPRKRVVSTSSESTELSRFESEMDNLMKSDDEHETEDEVPISKLKDENNILNDKEDAKDETYNPSNESESESDDAKEALTQEIFVDNLDIDSKNQTDDTKLTETNGVPPDNSKDIGCKPNLKKLEKKLENLKNRTCTVCLKVFRYPNHLKRHMMVLHNNEKRFPCTTCTSAFAHPEYLRSHMKKCPRKVRSVSRARAKKHDCRGCEEKFSSNRSLNNHMRTEHPNLLRKVFTCSYCAATFESRHECTVHTNSLHENDKEYLCTQCGQRFVRNRALEIHMRRHRGEKNYKCKFCSKAFVRAGDRDLHEKYHTGDKRYKCETCGLGFVRNYSLKVHMRIHTGEKPYHCESCPRTFAQSNDLKTHVRRDHTGERYVCEINSCGESFLQLYLLNKHKKNVHNVNAPSHIQRVKKIYETEKIVEEGDAAKVNE